jgi:hypothetical protein
MPKQVLEGEEVTLVPQMVDGEGVTEAMWVHIVDASSLSDAHNKSTKHVARQWSPGVVFSHNEDGIILPDGLQSRGDAFPDHLSCPFAEIDEALSPLSAGSLSVDLQAIVAKVQVAERYPAEFRGPNPSIEECQDYGSVAVGRGASVGDTRSGFPRPRRVARLEKRRNLLLRERLDGGRWGGRRLNGSKDVACRVSLAGSPGP